MDHEREIAALLAQVERAREARYKAQVTLEQLQQQRQQVLAELRELGVAPPDLDSEIGRLEADLADLLSRIRQSLPGGV